MDRYNVMQFAKNGKVAELEDLLSQHQGDLDLAHCGLGDLGACTLAEALKSNTSIDEVNISQNRITDQGIVPFAKAMEQNSTILRLHLNFNVFGDAGLVAVGKMLQINSTIIKIYLGSNVFGASFTAGGVAQLAQQLQYSQHVQVVDVNASSTGTNPPKDLSEEDYATLQTAMQEIAEVCQRNKEWAGARARAAKNVQPRDRASKSKPRKNV
jgi:hypothetical protein